jgi:hypothetical protein
VQETHGKAGDHLRRYFLIGAAAYGAGIVHYAVSHDMVYPFLGGWISGLVVMTGCTRRCSLKKA